MAGGGGEGDGGGDARPIRVLYLSHKRAEERAPLAACAGIRFEEVQIHLRRDLGRPLLAKLWRLAVLLRRFRPDLVLAETFGVYALPILILGRLHPAPLVVRYKGDLFAESAGEAAPIPLAERWARRANLAAGRWLLARAAAVLPVAPALTRALASRVRNGTALVEVPLVLPAAGGAAGVLRERPYLLSVTNFHFWAKVEPMMAALPEVHPLLAAHDLDWLILGDGVHLERCRALGDRFRDRVRFLGFADAGAHYAGPALALVHLSRLDGLPNVLLEAWARDLPVVLNRDSPVAELIEDGPGAVLVDLADPGALAGALGRLIADAGNRAEQGSRGGEWARRRFAPERVATILEQAITQAVARALLPSRAPDPAPAGPGS